MARETGQLQACVLTDSPGWKRQESKPAGVSQAHIKKLIRHRARGYCITKVQHETGTIFTLVFLNTNQEIMQLSHRRPMRIPALSAYGDP